MSATPAMCVLMMAGINPKPEAALSAALKRGQLGAIAWLNERPRTLVAIVLGSGVAGVVLLPLLGARLLPDFRENYLIAHASLRPGISLTETTRVGERISKGLIAIPGVKSVAEQIGRAENGQDPDAPNKSEFEVQIDPSKGHSAARSMPPSATCSTTSRISWWKSIRCWPNASARPCRANRPLLDQRDRFRSRCRRSGRCPDRRGAAAPAG